MTAASDVGAAAPVPLPGSLPGSMPTTVPMTVPMTVHWLVRRRETWWCAAALATAMALVDGFWLTSLQGAIGAVQRAQGPFLTWLVESALSAPVFAGAVVGGLLFAHRRWGADLGAPRRTAAAALVIACAGTVVGVLEVVASSLWDLRLQSAELASTHGAHGGSPSAALHDTVAVHVHAVGYAAAALLLTNLVVVAWTVALRGGRLDSADLD